YQSDNWRSAGEAHAGLTIATGHRAQSDGITIATEHRHQSDNWRSAGEAHAGITAGHRSDGITITIATGHRYQSDDRRWAGEAGKRRHAMAPSGCDRKTFLEPPDSTGNAGPPDPPNEPLTLTITSSHIRLRCPSSYPPLQSEHLEWL